MLATYWFTVIAGAAALIAIFMGGETFLPIRRQDGIFRGNTPRSLNAACSSRVSASGRKRTIKPQRKGTKGIKAP